jgi:hypothetical protein
MAQMVKMATETHDNTSNYFMAQKLKFFGPTQVGMLPQSNVSYYYNLIRSPLDINKIYTDVYFYRFEISICLTWNQQRICPNYFVAFSYSELYAKTAKFYTPEGHKTRLRY